jgi:hypothetical protein
MSDYFVRFVPENIYIVLSQDELKCIEKLNWGGNIPKLIFDEKIQFADAGLNFEFVKCPSCKDDLMEWWCDAMSSAYAEKSGFFNLETVTPCCSTETSLHDLEYGYQQGFYKIMIEVIPKTDSQFMAEDIAAGLLKITEGNWRVIHARY